MRSKKFFEKAALLCCGYGLMSDAVIVPLATSILREFPDTSEVLLNCIFSHSIKYRESQNWIALIVHKTIFETILINKIIIVK